LPIHLALKEGMEWSTELISIINANIHSLQHVDPCYDLYPFALAAVGPDYDLNSIFYMLSLHPEHIASGIEYTSITMKTSSDDMEVAAVNHDDDDIMFDKGSHEVVAGNDNDNTFAEVLDDTHNDETNYYYNHNTSLEADGGESLENLRFL
jgi:hypothetical protein